MLARATVERLIKHLDSGAGKRDNLERRIERLQPKVTSDLRRMLHIVRATANELLHDRDDPSGLIDRVLDDEDGPQLLELFLQTANGSSTS